MEPSLLCQRPRTWSDRPGCRMRPYIDQERQRDAARHRPPGWNARPARARKASQLLPSIWLIQGTGLTGRVSHFCIARAVAMSHAILRAPSASCFRLPGPGCGYIAMRSEAQESCPSCGG
jgi:hypothetical protein